LLIFQKTVVVIAYLLIIVELVFFPIPSEVSTVAILSRKKRSDYPHRGKKQKLSQMVYLAYVVVSSIVVLCIFCIPIAWVFWSPIDQWLLPLKIGNSFLFKLLGLIAIAAGSFISFWAVIELHAFIGTNPTRNRLKTNGIYSGSRNPITLGNSIIYIGFVFTVPTWVMIVGFIIYCFHIDHKIKMEEKNLESKFGSTFRDYKKKVGRYLR
jgi:protein-S-isoprenylcysteine O-methyltransferase Ste14